MHVSGLELAGNDHKIQAGMFKSQIFKSFFTSEQSVKGLAFSAIPCL